jgi:hypothetical protein
MIAQAKRGCGGSARNSMERRGLAPIVSTIKRAGSSSYPCRFQQVHSTVRSFEGMVDVRVWIPKLLRGFDLDISPRDSIVTAVLR